MIICAWPSCRQPSRLLRGCWDIICDRGRITLCHVTQPKWRHRQAPAAPQIIVQPAPVIIQQPPAATPAPPEPPAPHKHPGWSRGWSIGKVAGPALGTLAALVISLMSYSASHDANKLAARDEAAARATAKEQAAAQVSWYSPSRRQTVVVNASDSTISLPILYEIVRGLLSGAPTYDQFVPDATLPACSQLIIDWKKTAPPPFNDPDALTPFRSAGFAFLRFENRDGGWTIDQYGALYPDPLFLFTLSFPPRRSFQIPSSLITINPAPTCSPSAQGD
jgi:hypothetical protein